MRAVEQCFDIALRARVVSEPNAQVSKEVLEDAFTVLGDKGVDHARWKAAPIIDHGLTQGVVFLDGFCAGLCLTWATTAFRGVDVNE